MNRRNLGICLFFFLVSCCQYVYSEPKPDDAVHYRQGILTALGWNVGPMGAMVKGKVPYDSERFRFFSKRVELLAPMVREGFTMSSRSAKSDAREELWTHFDDFNQRLTDLEKASTALAKITMSGDQDAVVKQFVATVNVCKGCHDEYRVKQ